MREVKLKEIPRFPNYFAYVNGDIYSAKGKALRLLYTSTNHAGYKQVKMVDVDGIRQTRYVHRIIAETFYSYQRIAFPERTQVNHKNKQKGDNSASNLEWVTPSENAKHSARK